MINILTKRSNSRLIQQACQQDPDAWQQLVNEYTPMIYGVALRYARNSQDAKDITQEVLLNCYTNIHNLADVSRFGAWLHRITVNACHAWYRRDQTAWVTLDGSDHPALIAADQVVARQIPEPLIVYPDKQYQRLEAKEIVQKALAILPEKLQITTQRYYLEEMSYQEIATELNVPIGTVKRRLHDARHRLKTEVNKMMQEQMILSQAVGLETTGNRHTPIFLKGVHLPAAWTTTLSTAMDNQESLTIHILQGDAQDASACESIAKFEVSDISAGQARQTPRIRVTLGVDTKGKMTCTAQELPGKDLPVTGKVAAIAVEGG